MSRTHTDQRLTFAPTWVPYVRFVPPIEWEPRHALHPNKPTLEYVRLSDGARAYGGVVAPIAMVPVQPPPPMALVPRQAHDYQQFPSLSTPALMGVHVPRSAYPCDVPRNHGPVLGISRATAPLAHIEMPPPERFVGTHHTAWSRQPIHESRIGLNEMAEDSEYRTTAEPNMPDTIHPGPMDNGGHIASGDAGNTDLNNGKFVSYHWVPVDPSPPDNPPTQWHNYNGSTYTYRQ